MPDSDITPILREPVGSFKKLGSFTLAQKEVDRSKSHSDLANGNLIVSFVLLQNAFRAAMSDFLKVASSSPSSVIHQLMFCFTLSLLSRIKFEPFLIYLLLKSCVFLFLFSIICVLAKSIIRCLPSHSLLKSQSFTVLTVFSIIIVGIKSVIDLFILLCAAKPRISCNADSLYRS